MAQEETTPTIFENAFSDGFNAESLVDFGQQIWLWIESVLLTWNSFFEFSLIVVSFVLAWASQGWCRKLISVVKDIAFKSIDEMEIRAIVMPVFFAFASLLLVLIGSVVFTYVGWTTNLISVAIKLLAAWVVIRLASNFIGEPFWARTVAMLAWSVALLSILNLLQPVIGVLDALAIDLGSSRISVLRVLQAFAATIVLVWGAIFMSGLLQNRIDTLPSLTPSIRILIGKVSRIALIAMALFIALTSVGIDLSIFAVLGGAIGIGVGFGLQKIVGNFVSGLILLMDRSIKPGDVIEVAGTYGWVKSLGARYTSVVTRDGYEHLVPNEEFIVTTVTNWSFSDRFVRVKKPIGIAYGSDVRLAQKLVIEAAEAIDRVLKDPAVKCQLKGFGDNSIDLEVRFWLRDPESGVSNVSSEVLLGVWDRFHEHGIEFPFPQRDIHIKEFPASLAPNAPD